ncbi:MAG: nitrogen fixation protein [Cyanobacteriota bacterium]|nr:nitrogen fixation protein [Cyanobacteriota bacterium]
MQRLVEEAEADGAIRRSLRRCRSRYELLMACQRLGYRIQAMDLRKAQRLDQMESGGLSRAGQGNPPELHQAAD